MFRCEVETPSLRSESRCRPLSPNADTGVRPLPPPSPLSFSRLCVCPCACPLPSLSFDSPVLYEPESRLARRPDPSRDPKLGSGLDPADGFETPPLPSRSTAKFTRRSECAAGAIFPPFSVLSCAASAAFAFVSALRLLCDKPCPRGEVGLLATPDREPDDGAAGGAETSSAFINASSKKSSSGRFIVPPIDLARLRPCESPTPAISNQPQLQKPCDQAPGRLDQTFSVQKKRTSGSEQVGSGIGSFVRESNLGEYWTGKRGAKKRKTIIH